MTDDDAAADRLSDILDQEHDALLHGDLDRVARLADAREAAMAALTVAEAAQCAGLVEKAARNQRMLAAAARGIRVVSGRLAVLREGALGFRTYDADGRRASGPGQPHSLHRRA